MQSLLLPDADVIIGLHELELWNKVINSYNIYVAGTVAGEVTHFWKDGISTPINMAKHIADGKITILESVAEAQAIVLSKLRSTGLDGLDPGELESIALIYAGEIDGLKFCVRERLAIKAIGFLGLKDRAICVEQVLRDAQLIGKGFVLPPIYSKKRFERIFLEGVFTKPEEAPIKTRGSGTN